MPNKSHKNQHSKKRTVNRKLHNRTKKNVKDIYKDTALYPIIKPYFSGFLQVSKLHKIAYFLYGNPKGKPALVIHGGPGGGTVPTYARYFNPKKYMIILVDQRGSGKSTPFGEIRENTTPLLISDFEKIRELLNIKKWQLFGGSWGSALALAYSIQHPEVVTEIVLRGVFILRKLQQNWLQQGPGANYIFPEAWKMYIDAIPPNERDDLFKAYGRRFNGSMGKKERDKACLAWSQWEGCVSHLIPIPQKEVIKDLKKTKNYIPMSLIEYHYFSNDGFLPRKEYLFEKKNLAKIRKFPMTIVNGRYDVVCPIMTAYELAQKMPHATFYKTLAGHSMLEPENIKHLVMATNEYAKDVK
jgi:proline iminopeptidase